MATTAPTPPPRTAERPEIPVLAALVGGIVVAQILKRLGGDH